MKTTKGNGRRVIRIILASLALAFAAGYVVAEEAPLFHVNALTDSAVDLSKYVNGSVSTVTGDLGAPSAVWFHPKDGDLIDYIYIGKTAVVTFQVLKEGKTVSKHETKSRGEWESSVCPKYKDCPL